MNHETAARKIHKQGYGCASAVYNAFKDVNKNRTFPPAPRSEGGKCGAVLAAEKVLRETGTGKIDEFERQFLKKYGTLKCEELLENSLACNDFVGSAAAIVDTLL